MFKAIKTLGMALVALAAFAPVLGASSPTPTYAPFRGRRSRRTGLGISCYIGCKGKSAPITREVEETDGNSDVTNSFYEQNQLRERL